MNVITADRIMQIASKLLTILCLTLMISEDSSAARTPRKVDEYGAINCEDEMARLDNYAIELQSVPTAQAIVIVYGGRRGTKRDEVRARMAYIKHYLSVSRRIASGRIKVLNGGFRESLTTQLYLIPADADAKLLVSPTVTSRDVRFKRGKVGSRIRACSEIG